MLPDSSLPMSNFDKLYNKGNGKIAWNSMVSGRCCYYFMCCALWLRLDLLRKASGQKGHLKWNLKNGYDLDLWGLSRRGKECKQRRQRLIQKAVRRWKRPGSNRLGKWKSKGKINLQSENTFIKAIHNRRKCKEGKGHWDSTVDLLY